MTIFAGYLSEKRSWTGSHSFHVAEVFISLLYAGMGRCTCSKKTGSRNNLLSVGNTNESVSAAGEAAALGRLGRCRGVFGRGDILQNTGQRHIDIHRLTVTDNR